MLSDQPNPGLVPHDHGHDATDARTDIKGINGNKKLEAKMFVQSIAAGWGW